MLLVTGYRCRKRKFLCRTMVFSLRKGILCKKKKEKKRHITHINSENTKRQCRSKDANSSLNFFVRNTHTHEYSAHMLIHFHTHTHTDTRKIFRICRILALVSSSITQIRKRTNTENDNNATRCNINNNNN